MLSSRIVIKLWNICDSVCHSEINTQWASLCGDRLMMSLYQHILIRWLLLYFYMCVYTCIMWTLCSANITIFNNRKRLKFCMGNLFFEISLTQSHRIVFLFTSLKFQIYYSWTSITLIRRVGVHSRQILVVYIIWWSYALLYQFLASSLFISLIRHLTE